MRLARVAIFAAALAMSCAPQRGTIGAMLGRRGDGRVFVREAPPGLAAAKAGLREGDQILLVDGIDVRTLDEQKLHLTLSGDVGDPVKLTVERGDEVLRLTLVRSRPRREPPPPSPPPPQKNERNEKENEQK